jgi:SAM-dependent methyltransferase
MPRAAPFFDDEEYLRTVVAEKPAAESAAQAEGAARLAGCRTGAAILDAGCGNGRHALPLASAGYEVVGLDSSRLLLAAAQQAVRDARRPRFVRGSYAMLPFEPGSFDAVLCVGTALGYLGKEGDRAALLEFRRVLAPGGRLLIETLHRDELGVRLREREERTLASGGVLRFARRFDRARSVMRETQRLEHGAGDGSPRSYELRVYGEHELCRMLEEAGFALVGRHASLAGEGEPSPATPLVLVAELDPSRRPLRSALRHQVDLRRHDEVVAAQPGGGVRPGAEGGATPLQLDLGVVALGLGQQGDASDEPERPVEVVEGELPP